MKPTLVFSVVICSWTYIIKADINSGCPTWGCLSSGSFSFSSGVPPYNGVVKWSTEIVHVLGNLQVTNLRGCVSDQVAIVCSIHSGYVSLDLVTGNEIWNYTTMNYPYLPVIDVIGDIIGIDDTRLVYVDSSGFSKNALDISVLKPAFSVMLANNSMLLITASHTNNGQIVTYSVDGIVCGSISLRDTVQNVTGTFVPAGHPIIVGYRAYVITTFVPDVTLRSPRVKVAAGAYRLYAFDLWNHMGQRIKMAWYFNLDPERREDAKENVNSDPSVLDPVVIYCLGTVYVNIPVGASGWGQGHALQGIMWGIRDNGDTAFLLFRNVCAYGQMVVHDSYTFPDSNEMVDSAQTIKVTSSDKLDNGQTIWIASGQQNLITGYSSKNGGSRGYINITELANMDILTSKLAITRQSLTTPDDVLVFGGIDRKGNAYLVALETDSTGHARLLWKTKVSDEFQLHNNVTWKIVGQVVNIVHKVPYVNNGTSWQLGVVVMVVENGQGYTKLHIKAVF